MKHTRELAVYVDNSLETGELVIHPNDGFDLGLMNAQHPISLYFNARNGNREDGLSRRGKIYLRNTCKSGTMQISKKQWEMIGRESRISLYIKTDKIIIVTQKTKS